MRQLSCCDLCHLYILVEELEEAEKFASDAHVIAESSKSARDVCVAGGLKLDELRRILDHLRELVSALYDIALKLSKRLDIADKMHLSLSILTSRVEERKGSWNVHLYMFGSKIKYLF